MLMSTVPGDPATAHADEVGLGWGLFQTGPFHLTPWDTKATGEGPGFEQPGGRVFPKGQAFDSEAQNEGVQT